MIGNLLIVYREGSSFGSKTGVQKDEKTGAQEDRRLRGAASDSERGRGGGNKKASTGSRGFGGAKRIRTAVNGFADRYLTTRTWHHWWVLQCKGNVFSQDCQMFWRNFGADAHFAANFCRENRVGMGESRRTGGGEIGRARPITGQGLTELRE